MKISTLKKPAFFTLLVTLSLYCIHKPACSQANRGDVEFIKLFNALQQDLPRERIYLHTDRDWYFSGDRIWFSTYVTAGSGNILSELSTVVYVELYDPDMTLIEHIALKNVEGRSRGSIPLDVDLESGVYKLNTYTAWSKNFGDSYASTKEIDIHNSESDKPATESTNRFHVDFLPEGGHLVAGLDNRIGFKALTDNGRGLEVQGTLYNSSGNLILDFNSEHLGMGDFSFTPEYREQYYAIVNDVRFDLPESLSEGIVLSVSENDYDQFVLKLMSTNENLSEDYLVFGHVRGNVYMATEISITNGQGFTAVPKSTFATGVVHFTLLSREGEPISERLAFNDNPLDQLNVDLTLPENSVDTREAVDLGVKLDLSEEDEDITSFASITVFDDVIDSYNPYKSTIRSKFLLESDITGHVEDPGYYFSDAEERFDHADLLMLTQGWRSYDMSNVKDVEEISLFSLPEDGIKVSGEIRSRLLNRPVENANIVFSMGTEHDDLQIVTTNDEGSFTIPGLDVTGSEPITLRANNEDGNDNVTIRLSESFSHLPKDTVRPVQATFSALDVFSEEASADTRTTNPDSLLSRAESAQMQTESFADVQMQGDLDEIEVTGERETEDQLERDLRQRSSGSQRVDLDESPELSSLPMELLLNQIPGVDVNLSTNTLLLRTGATSFTGTIPPLILLDDIEIDSNYLFNIPPSDIQTINVFRRGTELAMYGSRGTGGVISVRSRTGLQGGKSSSGFETAFVEGYQPPTRFYSPRYGFNVPEDLPVKDTRITLHWEPEIEFSGESSDITFWTNDVSSVYRVEIQGITEFGTPFVKSKTFKVE